MKDYLFALIRIVVYKILTKSQKGKSETYEQEVHLPSPLHLLQPPKDETKMEIRQRHIRPRSYTTKAILYSAAILLLIASLVEGNSSLNPIAIGLRSAIARGPLGHGQHGVLQLVSSSRRRTSANTIDKIPHLQQWNTDFDNDIHQHEEEEDQCIATTFINRGGAAAHAPTERRLHFWEAMICGAISRSAAQTIMHPANTMKTILQSSRSVPGKTPLSVRSFTQWKYAKNLTRGAGAQLILSIPHGAVNFAVLEFVRRQMNNVVSQSRYADAINRNFGPGMDFLSSALSTICCSVVSTPQMMICDNIMAGTYPNLVAATNGLMKDRGVAGFYTGWWPGIAGKIPSYGLTWTLFEQIKRVRTRMFKRPAKDIENSIMGCIASATTVCIMIPMDTVKTRLVTQMNYPDLVAYKGINDCFRRVLQEEGIGAFYRGLTPRLLSVVPMIGIQFGVYEVSGVVYCIIPLIAYRKLTCSLPNSSRKRSC